MRKQYAKSDIKAFLEKVPFAHHVMTKKSSVVQEKNLLYVDGTMCFVSENGSWFPSLKLLLEKSDLLPKVVVDKGAIKFVVNGADIMRPGITSCDTFEKDVFVVIVDENYAKPLAVGKTLFNSKELMQQKGGKVVKNLHFVGDEYWSK